MSQSKATPQYVRFDKDMTNIVKGFAILFMLFLHCYYDGWYLVPLDFSHSLAGSFGGVFRICVDMFAFMVGYGYAFSKNKDLTYSLQHIKKLLIPFWLILLVFTVPICYKQLIHEDALTITYNLFGIDSTYNILSWFVYFFIFAMLVMPFISRFIDKKPVRNTIIVIIATMALITILHEIPRISQLLFGIQLPRMVDNSLTLALLNSLMLTPGMALGYLFAREGYYERIKVNCMHRTWLFVICCAVFLLTMVLSCVTRYTHIPFRHNLFYAPIVIGAIAVLFSAFKWKTGRWIFVKLGEVSVYMWFFHALFFTIPVKHFYQPAITIFSDVNCVTLWTIVLTFCASWVIKFVVDTVTNRISKRR